MKYKILVQILERPSLVEAVQTLDGHTFRKIIQHVGLEDSADLVSLASTEQLQEIFDEDLWKNITPGEEETFNEERFSIWLEVLMEVGSKFAAQKVVEMDEDLIVMALAKLVLVVDPEELRHEMREHEDEEEDSIGVFDKLLESTLSQEIQSYLLLARLSAGWDTVVNLLTALDEAHSAVLGRILERVYYASQEVLKENDGLFNILSDGEMVESDVAANREERREEQGFVAPTSAKAFLRLIEQTPLEKILTERGRQDHISKMYFRKFKGTPVRAASAQNAELIALLQSHNVLQKAPTPLLLAGGDQDLPIRQLLRQWRDTQPEFHENRVQELNYLANIILAGHSRGFKRFRPVEALEEALKIVNEGLMYYQQNHGALPQDVDLIWLFKISWKLRR